MHTTQHGTSKQAVATSRCISWELDALLWIVDAGAAEEGPLCASLLPIWPPELNRASFLWKASLAGTFSASPPSPSLLVQAPVQVL
jgi:hypothetical protein